MCVVNIPYLEYKFGMGWMLSEKIRAKEFGSDISYQKSKKYNIHPVRHPSNTYVIGFI
jgi:hypothetical protein